MKILAIILIILGVLVQKLEGVSIKKYNSKHNKGGFIFTALVSLFSMMFFVFSDKNGLSFTPEIIPYGIIAGILYCVASFLTYVALGCGSYVMSNLVLSYSTLLPIIYGIIGLKEPATIYTYLGLASMLIAIYFVRGRSNDTDNKFSKKWIIAITVSVFGSGMFTVVSRMQQIKFDNAHTNEFMVIALGFSAISLFIAGFIKDGKNLKYIVKNGSAYAILAGLSNGAANMLSLITNTMIAISIASPVRTGVKIVLSVIISRLLFKETLLKRQIGGFVLAAVGLVLLNI